MKIIIEADGGSRGNPGVAGSGAVLRDESGAEVQAISYAVGTATNNVAEYHGLLQGLQAAYDYGATEIHVRMDSKLVVEQMSGRWKIKHPDMKDLAIQCHKILLYFDAYDFEWIPRAHNARADELANMAMDALIAGAEPGIIPTGVTEPAAGDTTIAARTTPAGSTTPRDSGKTSPKAWNGATTKPTRLLLLRHGQTQMSVNGQYSGLSDPELTETGRWQATQAAERIAARGPLAAIVSSPLRRCQETASKVAELMGMEVITNAGMVELDFGRWEGKTFAEVMADDGDRHTAWLRDPTVSPPGGESLLAADRRVERARLELERTYAGETILVVSHVTPIKAMIRQGLAASMETYHRLHLDLASFSIVEFYSDGPTCVRVVNDTSHLRTSVG